MSKYDFDVIIIGSGVSGLTAAALLSQAGLKVCVLEKHYLIGGYLQGFQRKDFTFDTAIHWLNQYGENGVVTKVFNKIGPDFPRPKTMKRIQRHIGNEHEYILTNHPDELKDQLIRDFPHELKGIERFFKEAKKIAEVSTQFPRLFRSKETMGFFEKIRFSLTQLSISYPLFKHVFYSGEKGVRKGLNKYFKDEKLHEFFCAEQDLLSCLFPIAWAYNADYQNPPEGGSRVIPQWLEKQIADNGSEIMLNATVTGIDVQNDRFERVNFTRRHKPYSLTAKYLIAACDAEQLYEKLLPEDATPKAFKQNLRGTKLYSSSVTISIALNCPAEDLGFGNELTLLCNTSNKRMEHSSGDPHKAAISILAPSVRDKTLAPEGCGTLTLYVPAWMDYENNWKTTVNAKGEIVRTEAYKQLKDEFAHIIMDRVEKRVCPDLRKHIKFYEVATPVTYQRYTFNKNGTMMGGRPGKENMQAKVAHYRSPVKNIILGGHWAELGGGVPIAVKAAFNASLIVLKDLKKEKYTELVRMIEE